VTDETEASALSLIKNKGFVVGPLPSRRHFLAACSAAGLSSTSLPAFLWSQMKERGASQITMDMLEGALAVAAMSLGDDDKKRLLDELNGRSAEVRDPIIDDTVAPPIYYSPLVPGTKLDRTSRPFRVSRPPALKRPADIEDVAFWPLTHLAELIRTRQVTSTELTRMYLARLRRYDSTLHFVVTFTDDLALEQAALADQELAAGTYRGPLHGIPWGCKDIIAVPGYKTTWGSAAYREQEFHHEATVVKLLREAGAVLVAKLATGELAMGDTWFGGRTRNPWNVSQGSSGSSAGPASATAAGCVGFAIGSETSGSILTPATVTGATALRPTFGRVSRFGAMALSWSMDRLGPICRYAEDCAVVLHVIARTDDEDLSAIDLPFNWDAETDVRKLRVGYFAPGFAEATRLAEWRAHESAVFGELKALGVVPEPFDLPELPTQAVIDILMGEVGGAFDAAVRTGRLDHLPPARAYNFKTARLKSAVDYVQAQRMRTTMMRKFAEAVSKYDVYLAPSLLATAEFQRSLEEPAPAPPPPSDRVLTASVAARAATPTADHFVVANVCGYPAVSVPNGFSKAGTPTSVLFCGRLYNEAAILALAKAYQDRARWHTRTPPLPDPTKRIQAQS
jgi:Asp-tRNA(Asn)/Glu-tRNA(Gln) amidotransferase A subunit family amidase